MGSKAEPYLAEPIEYDFGPVEVLGGTFSLGITKRKL